MLKTPLLEQVLEDPKGGDFTVKLVKAGRGSYWSFGHSEIKGDELRIYGAKFTGAHADVLSGWIGRLGIYHIRSEVSKLIKKITTPPPKPKLRPKSVGENY